MRTFVVGGLALFLSSALCAAEQTNRFHVGVGASYAIADDRASADASDAGSLPIDGLPFEDEDVAWRAFAGWSPSEHWTFEAGYADLGHFESAPLFTSYGPVPTSGIVPRLSDDLLGAPGAAVPIDGYALVVASRGPTAGLDVTAWTLAAAYSRPFAKRWYGAVTAGLAYASFKTEDSLPVLVGFPTAFVNYPFVAPDDETGWLWGVTVGWRFAPSWSVELAYRQYDVKVVEIENVGVDLRFSF